MTDRESPRLDPRRAEDFRSELLERARAWMPGWNAGDQHGGFGVALLDVAARCSAQVAERLDRAGEKLSLGLLDWLAVRGKAARPARMPVAFKLADNATEPVLAPHPVRLQVDVDGAAVVFETEADARLVPGSLDLLVGADAAADEYFLPPPGLSQLTPREPLPDRWVLKNFADGGATRLQVDPALGLTPDALVEMAGAQYRIVASEGDLVTIEPGVQSAQGLAQGTELTRVSTFVPFGGTARNQQQHIVYFGDKDLFNVEASVVFEVFGTDNKLADAQWEYWGKTLTDDEVQWRPLTRLPDDVQRPGALRLEKPEGAMEPRDVGNAKGVRWVRALQTKVADASAILSTDALTISVNPGATAVACADAPDGPPTDGFTNNTALVTTSVFYPLGKAPKQFDTFYLGCVDAFSKKGADVSICFEMADPSTTVYAVVRSGPFAGSALASVGADGALHLSLLKADGTLGKFFNRDPLQPKSESGELVTLDPRPAWRLPVWDRLGFANLPPPFPPMLPSQTMTVAVTAGPVVYLWLELLIFPFASNWLALAPLQTTQANSKIDALVYLDDAADPRLFAAFEGKLYSHSADPLRRAEPWTELALTGDAAAVDEIRTIAAVQNLDSFAHGTVADGLVAAIEDGPGGALHVYLVDRNGKCKAIDAATEVLAQTQPAAAVIGNTFAVVWHQDDEPVVLRAASVTRSGPAANPVLTVDATSRVDSPAAADADARLIGGSLDVQRSGSAALFAAAYRNEGESWLTTWTPYAVAPNFFEARVPDGRGPLGGAPTLLANHVIVPGVLADAWIASWQPGLRKKINVTLATGIVIPAAAQALAPGDIVGFADGPATRDFAMVQDFGTTLAAERFHAIEDDIGIGFGNPQLLVYRRATSSSALASGAIQGLNMELAAGDTAVADEWLLLQTGASSFNMCRVDSVNSTVNPWRVVLAQSPGSNTPSRTYWHAQPLVGRFAPYFELNSADGDWDAALLDRGDLKIAGGVPEMQRGVAFKLDGNEPRLIVLAQNWDALLNSSTTVELNAAVGEWLQQLGDTASNPELLWEYWNGTNWAQLALTLDQTLNFKQTGRLEFEVPQTLAPTDVNGKVNHWIRARLIGGDYGQEKVRVITKQVTSDTTEQTIERSPADLRPPLVVRMVVRYELSDKVLPKHLLTQDSGSLRDQSDANRTTGALVEALVPLSVLMQRLDAAASPAPQSLLLGLNANLIGEPINVLLLVEERAHDGFAPLAVDALVNDRFEAVAVRDTTRALGENGLLSMSFPVKPSPRDLFGRTLTWLRLRPSRQAAAGLWQPVVRGAYLNAAWASATETLTRESLGSSDGRPFLTVQVARPPLLQDSLELRVREPLDDEERQRLLDENPASVKFNEPDLKGDWVLWRQVADPNDYGPRERVYALDEQSGEIHFGDGRHGMIPPIGRDSIVAFSYQRTEALPGSASVPANAVKASTALQLVTPVESVEAAFAADRAAGGAPPESDARVLRFGNARLRHRERALAPSDFEDLALQSSQDIAQVRAFRRVHGLRLVVVMRGPQPAPDASQRRELKRVLQSSASPLLGLRDGIVIDAPKVRHLRLRLSLRVASLDDAGRLGDEAKRRLTQLFDSATGGMTEAGWPLGAAPTEEDIAYALGSATDLAGIDTIEMREIDARGREQPWPARLQPDELVMLADDAFRISYGSLEQPA